MLKLFTVQIILLFFLSFFHYYCNYGQKRIRWNLSWSK